MEKPILPGNEDQRMASLRAMDVVFTPNEERFDRITRIASQLLGAPISLVSLVADQCQWFKSAHGLSVTETSREVSFCGHAILQDETFIVGNAAEDHRFRDNPLVTGDPNIRFYAGHPLHCIDGNRIGTLCVIDRNPRTLSPEQINLLKDLAAIAESELQRGQLNDSQRDLVHEMDDLKLRASVDGLTRLWNRTAIMELLGAELERAKRGVPMCLAMIDIDHFKKVNDTYGHQTGDAALVEVAARIRRALREYDSVGRYGGEEFIAVLSNANIESATKLCQRIRLSIEAEPISTPVGPINVTVSIGLAAGFGPAVTMEGLLAIADAALYRAKEQGRNRLEIGSFVGHA